MPLIAYDPEARLSAAHLDIVEYANVIIEEYAAQGFTLTLRQIYYQFVARGRLENRDREYKRLGGILNAARLAGLVDWDAMVDRTRFLREEAAWDSPANVLEAVADQFRIPKWDRQPERVEVWIEKDALVGVIEPVCQEYQVPFLSCRGYTSQSEMWAGAMRIALKAKEYKQATHIIHLGDHDPSGIDMSRDIEDRITMFLSHHNYDDMFTFKRIALNFDQVEQYSPPPNPAKLGDSRATSYIDRFGTESWELDALSPTTLAGLIRDEIFGHRDPARWEEAEGEETKHRELLAACSDRWDEVTSFLDE